MSTAATQRAEPRVRYTGRADAPYAPPVGAVGCVVDGAGIVAAVRWAMADGREWVDFAPVQLLERVGK